MTPEEVLEMLLDTSHLTLGDNQASFIRTCFARDRVGWICENATGSMTALALLAAVLLQAHNTRVYTIHSTRQRANAFKATMQLLVYKAEITVPAMCTFTTFAELEDCRPDPAYCNVLFIDQLQTIERSHGLGRTQPSQMLRRFAGVYMIDKKRDILQGFPTLIYGRDILHLVTMLSDE